MVAATCSPCLIKQIIANSSEGRRQNLKVRWKECKDKGAITLRIFCALD